MIYPGCKFLHTLPSHIIHPTLMNLYVFPLSLFAASCLAADNSSIVSPDHCRKSNDSVAIFARSAYEVGCELAKVEKVLVTNTVDEKVSMCISRDELLMKVLDYDLKPIPPLTEALSKMFNFKSLFLYLPSRTSDYIGFGSLLSEFSRLALIPDATIVLHTAILKWTVQTIDNKNDDKVVVIWPHHLKVIGSLSLLPEIGTDEHFIADITKVLDEIPKLLPSLDSELVIDLVYSLIALLKQLQSPKILEKLEEVLDIISSLDVETYTPRGNLFFIPLYQFFEFYCLAVLGEDHSLSAKFSKKASTEQLAIIWADQTGDMLSKSSFKAYSLGSVVKLIDKDRCGMWRDCVTSAMISCNRSLRWKNVLFDNDANNSQLFVFPKIPDIMRKDFYSCATMEELYIYLGKPQTARVLLIHEISIWEAKVPCIRREYSGQLNIYNL